VSGTLTAADANPGPSLKPARMKGGPGLISFKLRPAGKAKRRLARRGKLKLLVRLGFVPDRVKGECVTQFSPCYSSDYAISQTAGLTLKAKKHR
jgi:hypothetical protein